MFPSTNLNGGIEIGTNKMSSNLPKLLVVSKSVFHALDNCDEKLCSFVKNYNVVLPHSLAIECVISEPGKKPDKEPEKLLRGLDKAIKAGANIGYQSGELLAAEKITLCPIKSIVDEPLTQKLRNSTSENSLDLIKKAANHCMEVTEQIINGFFKPIAETLYNEICKNKDFMNKFSKPTNKKERRKEWIRLMDHNNTMKNTLNALFSKQINYHADANWYTWQLTRLWCSYCWELSHKKSLHSSCEKKDISNDFYDIEPVLYLLRADGLLTNDQCLEIPLAEEAFPTKDVFEVNTSKKTQDLFDDIINTIPNEYRLLTYEVSESASLTVKHMEDINDYTSKYKAICLKYNLNKDCFDFLDDVFFFFAPNPNSSEDSDNCSEIIFEIPITKVYKVHIRGHYDPDIDTFEKIIIESECEYRSNFETVQKQQYEISFELNL